MSLRTISVVAALIILSAAITNASELVAEHYACALDGAQVVPPTTQVLGGDAWFDLSATNELSMYGYECLIEGQELVAHIHGPANPGEIGPIIFTLPPATFGFREAVLGVLDDQQLHDLNCGLWYMDIHTYENPLGQARGRIRGLWGWQVPNPCALPVQESTWGEVKSLYR